MRKVLKPKAVTYIIARPCVDVLDRVCVEKCPVDCIYKGKRMLYIRPGECMDCGACEPVYPVEAILCEDDIPDKRVEFIDANVDWFDELGSPGGAAKLGPQDFDMLSVAALPPQAED